MCKFDLLEGQAYEMGRTQTVNESDREQHVELTSIKMSILRGIRWRNP